MQIYAHEAQRKNKDNAVLGSSVGSKYRHCNVVTIKKRTMQSKVRVLNCKYRHWKPSLKITLGQGSPKYGC
jgi:hypothetical protein